LEAGIDKLMVCGSPLNRKRLGAGRISDEALRLLGAV
jgi:hypothetical protein